MDSNVRDYELEFLGFKTLLLSFSIVVLTAIVMAQEGTGALGGTGSLWEWSGISMAGFQNFADQLVLFRIQSTRDVFIFLGILLSTSMPAYIAFRRGFMLFNNNVGALNTDLSRGEQFAILLMSLGTGYLTATIVGFWFAGTILILTGIAITILGPLVAYRWADQATGGTLLPDGGQVPDGGAVADELDTAERETQDLQGRVSQTESEESRGASEDRIIHELEIETEEAQDVVRKLEAVETDIERELDRVKQSEDKILEAEEQDEEELQRIQQEQTTLMENISRGVEVAKNRGLSDEVMNNLEQAFSNEIEDLQRLNHVLEHQANYIGEIGNRKPFLDNERQNIQELEEELQQLVQTESEMEKAEKNAEDRAATPEEKEELSETERATSQIEEDTEKLEEKRKELSQKLEADMEELETEAQELKNEANEVEQLANELRQEESDLYELRDILKNAEGPEVEELQNMLDEKIQIIENVESKAGTVVEEAKETLQRF